MLNRLRERLQGALGRRHATPQATQSLSPESGAGAAETRTPTRIQTRILKVGSQRVAFGLNWQHCGDTTFFPSHSFERYYQAVRRFLRFGRVGPVRVSLVTTDGQAGVLANLQRKADAAEIMFGKLVSLMRDGLDIRQKDNFNTKLELPKWLSSTHK